MRGFTLLEILISVVVLSIGVLLVMALLPAVSRAGAQVERGQQVSRALPGIVSALQDAARQAQTRDLGRGEATYMVLRHPAALDGKGHDPASPEVIGSRACLLLPRGSDTVLLYPRDGWPEEIRKLNGGGRVADAEPAPDLTEEELANVPTYRLDPNAQGTSLGFALRVQRAHHDGQPTDGLYSITILFFLIVPDGEQRLLHTFTTEVCAGPGAEANALTTPLEVGP